MAIQFRAFALLAGFIFIALFSPSAFACGCGSGYFCEPLCAPSALSVTSDFDQNLSEVTKTGIIKASSEPRRSWKDRRDHREWRRYRRERWQQRRERRQEWRERREERRNNQSSESSTGTGSTSGTGNTGGTPAGGSTTGSNDHCFNTITGDRICPQEQPSTPNPAPTPSPTPAPAPTPSNPSPPSSPIPTPPAPATPVNSGNAGSVYEWPPGFECAAVEGGSSAPGTVSPAAPGSGGSTFDTSKFTKHLYVATTGSDSNPGTQAAPFKTITKASQAATPGTLVHVAPGTYPGGFQTTKSGTASARIGYISDTKWGAKIVPASSSGGGTGWSNRGQYVDIVNFEIDGKSNGGWKNGLSSTGSYSVMQGNHIHHVADKVTCDSQGGSGINTSSWYDGYHIDVIGNVVHHIGITGCKYIQGIYTSTSGKVKNNLVYNIGNWGIHLWHDARELDIANNTIVNSGGGITVGGGGYYRQQAPADNVHVSNNIVAGNDKGIWEQGDNGSHNTYTNNITFNNARGNLSVGNSAKSGNLTVDPQFVSASDFHLKPTSPAIDKGAATYAPANDIDGGARPHGGGIDIGAYESGSTPGTSAIPVDGSAMPDCVPEPTPAPAPAPAPVPAPPTPVPSTPAQASCSDPSQMAPYERVMLGAKRVYNFDGSAPFVNPVTKQSDLQDMFYNAQYLNYDQITNAGAAPWIQKVNDGGAQATRFQVFPSDKQIWSWRSQQSSFQFEYYKHYQWDLEFKLDPNWNFNMPNGDGLLWQAKSGTKPGQYGNSAMGLNITGDNLYFAVLYPNSAMRATSWPSSIKWEMGDYVPTNFPKKKIVAGRYYKVRIEFFADDRPPQFGGQGYVNVYLDGQLWVTHKGPNLPPDYSVPARWDFGWYNWGGQPSATRIVYFKTARVSEKKACTP